MPFSSVHRECFQFRRCETTAVQCELEAVLVSSVLSTRTLGTMMELSVEDLLRNSCVIHTNYMSTPTELCILQKCLCSTNAAKFEYSGVGNFTLLKFYTVKTGCRRQCKKAQHGVKWPVACAALRVTRHTG